MLRVRPAVVVCLLLAGVLFVAAVVLAFANVSVNVTAGTYGVPTPAGEVECSIAPWDAGINGNDDRPGGERTADYSEEVGTECYAANVTRFRASVASGAGALVVLFVGMGVEVRSRRRLTSD